MKLKPMIGAVLIAVAIQVTSTAANETAKTDCASLSAKRQKLNARQLFDAYVACTQKGENENAALMLVLGQIRARADIALLAPINEDEGQKVGELYSALFYQFGGLGFNELYRNPETVNHLASLIGAATLEFTVGYSPGWKYKKTSKTDIYDQMIASAKSKRVWQMHNYALRMQNSEYYAAHKAMQTLRQKNRVFKTGTAEYAESRRLRKLMQAASSKIEKLPPPEDKTPYKRLNEPDPNSSIIQIGKGFNGPKAPSTHIFRSDSDVRNSWLANAYSSTELRDLIAKIDFKKQVLIGVSFGRRMNASGTIRITHLDYSTQSEGYNVAARMGVIKKSCGVEFSASFPFVLAFTDAFPNAKIQGWSSSNFPDDCGPIRSGTSSGKP